MKPGMTRCWSRVDGGYSHEFTTAQVHTFLAEEYGDDYQVQNADKFAVFEDHLLYADGVAKICALHWPRSRRCAICRRSSSSTPACATTPRATGVSPGICHQVARESSSIRATSSRRPTRTPAWAAATNALSYGVGATEYAGLIALRLHVREGARVDPLRATRCAELPAGTHRKGRHPAHPRDVYAVREDTLNRVDGVRRPRPRFSLSMDERATL